mmetsp:Transcript_19015/g.13811  ORF Transcript_19015/g.13811 Transcript_19015/m.13811 type:complete len:125 (-) Transcript_19015:49-423(-)
MLLNTEKVKKWTFRLLVLAIFLSIVYDIFWFMVQDLGQEHADDGGLEKGIRNFSLSMSYLSFFTKLILGIIFWKDSVDFVRVIKKKQDMKDPREMLQSSPDRKRKIYEKQVNEVVKEFEGIQQY